MAGSSCDDIFVIVLFYSFKNVVSLSLFNFAILLQIPISIILGILQGIIVGLILAFIFRKFKFNRIVTSILTLGVSLLLVYCEQILKILHINFKFIINYCDWNSSSEIFKKYRFRNSKNIQPFGVDSRFFFFH